jgi:hypothetical protein
LGVGRWPTRTGHATTRFRNIWTLMADKAATKLGG